ncbi:MAG TPA: MBL fold metallo-hydrolase [Thermoleophilaceae bacterium]|nr:MBL fold metallo-hydrolase [Thermoleophilaceae bacterium]
MPRLIDVKHLGLDRVIGSWLVDGVLIDPGPESTVDTLLAGVGDERPRALLLTHIHFDHAGASGALVERWPDLRVYVHERGARHMADPERLVASARQIWGEDFDRLWGRVVPVPEANLEVLSGGETVEGFDVEYTPGHAKHHVSYFHRDTGHAYVGDVAGVRIPPSSVVRAPTPPPDIDVEAWFDSLNRIEARDPSAIVITHFGRIEDVAGQLAAAREALQLQADLARELDEHEFVAELNRIADEQIDEELGRRLFDAGDPADFHAGLRRYWQKVAAA